MQFKTTDAHEALRAEIRQFAETEVKPYAFEWDPKRRDQDSRILAAIESARLLSSSS